MISVSEAKSFISKNIVPLPPAEISIENASGHILAAGVVAICDIPAFRQSSMDGYAIKFAEKDNSLIISGEMAAGAAGPFAIESGQACRIFTGGPLPDGADTVVMQEKVMRTNNRITINQENLKYGDNVRDKGAEIKTGQLAMQKDSYLTPAALGYLAGIGLSKVLVYPLPKVAIILTGKELLPPGNPLAFGQVYESNSYSLKAALKKTDIENIEAFFAGDELTVLQNILQSALQIADVVLLTGGVSVGDYDFVVKAAELCGVKQVFHKVKQKPGKPLYFGTLSHKLVFGLPGNPSSVLNCFYNYVLPAIAQLSKKENPVKEVKAVLGSSVSKPAGLTQFLKGDCQNGLAQPLGAQESFRLSSFAYANCLICLEETRGNYLKGEEVNVLLLPD
jgi:molybdopterin molybdotransferase